MSLKTCLSLLLIMLVHVSALNAQISDKRKFQLDSIVSTMPVQTRKDLWKAHAKMDSAAVNNEEKVWMFYGYIATNFKYDYERMWDKKAPEYSPELTAQKGKAVCRDFARVFVVLCTKSNIKCIDVHGKADVSFIQKVKSYLHFNFQPGLHAWNMVQIDSSWHLMDPTWSRIASIDKVKVYSDKTRTYQIVRVKRCLRDFYDPDGDFMAATHAPNHPAFYLLDSVPTYKTAFKKRKDLYAAAFNFNDQLDSIFTSEFPEFSPLLNEGSDQYSGGMSLDYYYRYELTIPLLRPTRFQTFTIATYDEAEARINRINAYLLQNYHSSYTHTYEDFKKKIDKKRAALKRLEEQNKKYKKQST